jgi:hypothetical protein
MPVSIGGSNMKTAPTSKKIRELISMVKEGKLTPRPEFQRRLVWTRNDKDYFLDTILRGYPFPEIYLADGDVDLETGQGTQLLVDGLQRVSTIIQYFEGDPDLKLTTVQPYRSLSEDDKKIFLLYDVAVRDLGAVSREEIVEVFKRINATPYSLLDIEVNNAVYTGALKKYAERLAEDDFFESHKVFTAQDFKRMGDLRYALTVVITLIQGYFNRDDALGELLDRYNDDFPLEPEIDQRIHAAFDFIEECGFTPSSRVWKKADLFTLITEIDQCLNVLKVNLQPSLVVEKLNKFYEAVEASGVDVSSIASIYYKAALQASNDRVNRLRRGMIIGGIIQGQAENHILKLLKERALV